MNKVIVLDKINDVLDGAKSVAGIGLKIVKASEDLICKGVAFLSGLLIGTLCSKCFKKIAWFIAVLTGIGVAYLVYRHFSED